VKHTSVLGLVIAALLSANASGQELQYGVRAGASYSDNVRRTATDEESSGAALVGVDIRALRETGRLQYDVYGDVEYREYFEDDVDSETFGRLIAETSYAIVPETFDWMLSGSFDQIREDILSPAAPGNIEDVITLSTGPRVTGRVGDAFEVQGEAHYTLADYSERPFDSETVGGTLALGRRLSERSFLGAGASYDDVTYKSDLGLVAPDFERREYFLRFNTQGSRTTFDADVGVAQIEGTGFDEDGPMARLRLTRRLTPSLSGFVEYTREFPTSADATLEPQSIDGAVVGDASLLFAGPRENESGQVGVLFRRTRTSGMLAVAHREETSLTIPALGRDVNDINASISRQMTSRSTISGFARYTEDSIDTPTAPTVDSEETVIGAQLSLAFGRMLSVDFIVQRRERDSDDAGGSFEELSGGVFVRYGTTRRLGTTGAPSP